MELSNIITLLSWPGLARLLAAALCCVGAAEARASDDTGVLWLSEWMAPVAVPKGAKRGPKYPLGLSGKEMQQRMRDAAKSTSESKPDGKPPTMPVGTSMMRGDDRLFWLYRGSEPATSRPAARDAAPLRLIGETAPAQEIAPATEMRRYMAQISVTVSGHYNAYVTEARVSGGRLEVETAKSQFVRTERGVREPELDSRAPLFNPEIPLELVREREPGDRIGKRLISGEEARFTVRAHGVPVAGIPVTLISQTGWRKTAISDAAGSVRFRMLRDEFPDWKDFSNRIWSTYLVVAERILDESGEYRGVPYVGTRIRASLADRYYPSPRDYRSYAYGLGIIGLTLLVSGIAVFVYRERRTRKFKETRFDEAA